VYLSKPEILGKLAANEIVTYPDPRVPAALAELGRLVQEAHLELRLGEEAFVTRDQVPTRLSRKEEFVSIPPGEFALLTTYEKLYIPGDLTAFISIKLRYKILGLVNISGFHVDPHFRGKLIFSVYNVGPSDIVLRYKDPIFIIFFATLSSKVEGPRMGQFQDQEGLKTETVISLRAAGLSLTTLEKRLSRSETILYVIGGLFVPLFALLVGLILRGGIK
jgi:dCTP deaminase